MTGDATALDRRVSLFREVFGGMALDSPLLLDAYAEGFHLAVEVGAFEAQGFGGAGDVAVVLVDFFEDVVAFVGFAGFDEGGALVGVARGGAGAFGAFGLGAASVGTVGDAGGVAVRPAEDEHGEE